MSETQLSAIEKKIYTKPQLTKVRLVAEEAVLGFCKSDGAMSGCAGQGLCSDDLAGS